LYRLIDEPRWDYRLVHCDLEHFLEPADLLTALVVQLARDDVLSKIASALSYVPKKAWQGFRANVEEIEVHKLKLKLKEQIQPRWQSSGEELFDAIARSPETVVFLLDEFAVMIDEMAHLDARRRRTAFAAVAASAPPVAAHQERAVSGGRVDRHWECAQ
jgi:hypothetical protein